MFGSKEDLASLFHHLAVAQGRVERAMGEARHRFDDWLANLSDESRLEHLRSACVAFRDVLDVHFARTAGEGILESAVNLHPSLSSEFCEIERQQSQLLTDLDELVAALAMPCSTAGMASQLRARLIQIQARVVEQGQRERHFLARGVV